jgi:riboflavin-specific deaminase-like protein
MAQSINGFISKRSGDRALISSTSDNERVMEIRNSVDGILVGYKTIISDNPNLIALENEKTSRIIIDPNLLIDSKQNVMDGKRPTIILNCKREERNNGINYIKCGEPFNLEMALTKLKDIHVNRLLVEGGKVTAEHFLRQGYVDEMFIFIGDIFLEGQGKPMPSLNKEIRNIILDVKIMKGGILLKLDPSKFKEENI